jgi:CrcB protein
MTVVHAAPSRVTLYLAVALGSALGGLARCLVSDLWQGAPGMTFPWGTLFANVSGSLLIGAYAALIAPGGRWSHGLRTRLFVMTGVCGGYTTFSIFSLEAIMFLQLGRYALAGIYVGASLALWLAAAWAGFRLLAPATPAR